MKRFAVPIVGIFLLGLLCGARAPLTPASSEELLREDLTPEFAIPFIGLVLSMAILPLVADRWWERAANKAKIAFLFAVPLAALLIFHFGQDGINALTHEGREYVSFIILIGSLFIIAGGIDVEGVEKATPAVNTAILAIGAVLANVASTTGASMILVRPLIRANRRRRQVTHVLIFFIFIVCNCGGLLTPLGDPPLLLGYLAGVPFEWTLRLFPQWAFVNGSLLAIFYIWDRLAAGREGRSPANESPPEEDLARKAAPPERLRISGLQNVVIMLAVVATTFAAGRGLGNGGRRWPFCVPEGVLLLLTAGSFFLTKSEVREKNQFTFRPIIEVAILFLGLFITMTPALLILNARGESMNLHEPWQYFWSAGLMSSFLDNAPSYLAAAATAAGAHTVAIEGKYLGLFLELDGQAAKVLAAIACGCVFMGANTYIGNAPNLLVKAIAEESNIRMPGFLGYMAYSMPVLIPLFGLVSILFFRV